MPNDVLSLSFEAVPKIGLLAVVIILVLVIGGLFIVPAMQSAARARERRMQSEDEDEQAKMSLIKAERERFDNERKDQWLVFGQKLDQIIFLSERQNIITQQTFSLVNDLNAKDRS